MKRHLNSCGIRNNFGYCDYHAKEIILKHPCLKKEDINDVYTWLDDVEDLKKFSIGVGAVENCITEDNSDSLYNETRRVIKQSLEATSELDNQVLKNILSKLKNQKMLKNLSLKCYTFSDDTELFDYLSRVIVNAKDLIYLDLSGCNFSDKQLSDLAEIVANSHIAHLVWPEPRISELLIEEISHKFMNNKSLVVMYGVPSAFQKIAQNNRAYLFGLARRPSMIGEDEKKIITEYATSFRLAIAFEKQCLFDLEKTVEAVLA